MTGVSTIGPKGLTVSETTNIKRCGDDEMSCMLWRLLTLYQPVLLVWVMVFP